MIIEPTILSVSEFHKLVNGIMDENIGEVLVKGEISDIRISQGKWVSFFLKDESSILPCFSIKEKISIPLEEGQIVKILGKPKIYPKFGKYSFQIIAIQAMGEGVIKKAFQNLILKLDKEGMFDENHKLPLPEFPEQIGLITSVDGAAITDVEKVLTDRWGDFELIIKPVSVQGIKAESEILRAINFFNHHYPVDVIILTRGGGSIEDLQVFNSELLARAIFASRTPIISAIGHERDVTIAELVSDKRAATPSNAAQLAVPDRKTIEIKIQNLETRIKSTIESEINDHSNLIKYADSLVYKVMENAKTKIQDLLKLLNSLCPEKVLERGYSITKNKHGTIIKSIKKVKRGAMIETILQDGKIISEVI